MLSLILLLTPLLVWLLSNFLMNSQKINITKENYKILVAMIFSGLSIYFTVERDGFKNKTIYLFSLAVFLELVYVWFIKNNEEDYESVKQTILFLLLSILVINSWRLLYQIRHKVYDGALCLMIYLIIVLLNFMNNQ